MRKRNIDKNTIALPHVTNENNTINIPCAAGGSNKYAEVINEAQKSIINFGERKINLKKYDMEIDTSEKSKKSKKSDSYSDYSYSDYYSDSELDEGDGINFLTDMFKEISKNIVMEEVDENLIYQTEEEINKSKHELTELQALYGQNTESIKKQILYNKSYFVELLDFFEKSPDPKVVKKEFLDPFVALAKIKWFRKTDPALYMKSLMGHSAGDILRYYAEIELRNFSFLLCRPMIDMMWIRAGFTWEEEDGDTELVPRIIYEYGDDFVSKLKDTELECEHDFMVVFAHIMEIVDLSIYPEKLRIQLTSTFRKKLDQAKGIAINNLQYENILFKCGLK